MLPLLLVVMGPFASEYDYWYCSAIAYSFDNKEEQGTHGFEYKRTDHHQ